MWLLHEKVKGPDENDRFGPNNPMLVGDFTLLVIKPSGPSHAKYEDGHSSPPENQVRIDIHYWTHVANDLKDGPRQGILIADSEELW